jgi:hypothetical protein
MARGAGKIATMPLQIGEHPVTAFPMKSVQFALEKCLEVHAHTPEPTSVLVSATLFVNPGPRE